VIGALRFVLTGGPRTDRTRSLLVVAVAVPEQATGTGLAVPPGLFSEAASRPLPWPTPIVTRLRLSRLTGSRAQVRHSPAAGQGVPLPAGARWRARNRSAAS
jgi:hypothetical protein